MKFIIALFSVPIILFSADIYYDNGMVIRNCEIVEENKSGITIRSYSEYGTQESYIVKRIIKHIDHIDRDESQLTVVEKYDVKRFALEDDKVIISEVEERERKKFMIGSDIKINTMQFASGLALVTLGSVFAYDVFASETGFNNVIDDVSGDLKKEFTIKRNLRVGASIVSIIAGVLNIHQSIENFEINTTPNNVGISYKF